MPAAWSRFSFMVFDDLFSSLLCCVIESSAEFPDTSCLIFAMSLDLFWPSEDVADRDDLLGTTILSETTGWPLAKRLSVALSADLLTFIFVMLIWYFSSSFVNGCARVSKVLSVVHDCENCLNGDVAMSVDERWCFWWSRYGCGCLYECTLTSWLWLSVWVYTDFQMPWAMLLREA